MQSKEINRTALLSSIAPVRDADISEPMAQRIPEAAFLSGMSRSAIYREAGRGNIVLLKHGRTTLVDMASLRAFLAGLPRASIKAPREAA